MKTTLKFNTFLAALHSVAVLICPIIAIYVLTKYFSAYETIFNCAFEGQSCIESPKSASELGVAIVLMALLDVFVCIIIYRVTFPANANERLLEDKNTGIIYYVKEHIPHAKGQSSHRITDD
jgi:hypothetical protein